MNTNFRRQILKILAQLTVIAPNTTSGPTSISGTPTNFDPYSYYNSMFIGWDAKNVPLIRKLTNDINWTIFVLSSGQLDLNKLRATNFTVDASKYPDRILIMMVKFAVQVYNMIYSNRGQPFKTAVPNRDQLIQSIKNSLTTLPDGSINSLISNKLGGNPKTIFINTLSQIK